jgi:peptide-methionine (S)-S-oxide reductase
MDANLSLATFGSGCFWCSEAVFKRLRGVTRVTPGYAGGTEPNPTYEQVCAHRTGHAEVAQIEFDPAQVSYEQLVEVFFGTHDPTTRDRQGDDVGRQYRSIILHHDEAQRATAAAVKARLGAEGLFTVPIVTEIEPLGVFWPAEDYHRDYFARNPRVPYCAAVIDPKVAKFRKKFAALLKPE